MQQNGNYEQLIDQITDMVLAKLGGDEYCPTFCRADMERIVDAGAERVDLSCVSDDYSYNKRDQSSEPPNHSRG